MHLIVISGMSGAGKSVALNALEDLGCYCSDNLPAGLLKTFLDELSSSGYRVFDRIGVGIDARSLATDVERMPALVQELRAGGLSCEIIFLQAKEDVLLSRFSETRRRHPLSDKNVGLLEAIVEERKLLAPMIDAADLIIDTSATTAYDLREQISERIAGREPNGLSILVESFGYKHGLPGDADFVFDVRCLPNPYWEPELKPLTGLDEPVRAFLDAQPRVQEMVEDVAKFLESWIPRYRDFQRSYLTVAIGCTGGQHRSVYVTEEIAKRLSAVHGPIRTRHHELPK